MLQSSRRQDSESKTNPLSIDELIRSELEGKVTALTRYDEILWKVRAGYVTVIYGAAVLLVGKESKTIATVFGVLTLLQWLQLVAVVLSISIMTVDWYFLVGKLRVVAARNRLSDLALKRASKEPLSDLELAEVRTLLHITGESSELPPLPLLLAGAWPLIPIYIASPLAIYLIAPNAA